MSGGGDAGLGVDALVLGGSASGTGGIDATLDTGRVDIGGSGAGATFFGFDAFAKTGTSVFELTGSNSGTASFEVEGGTLVMDAALPDWSVRLASARRSSAQAPPVPLPREVRHNRGGNPGEIGTLMRAGL